ncbi:MAG: hypothetical protein H7836_10285, partial [Magnetococcus sp. YQC-3]
QRCRECPRKCLRATAICIIHAEPAHFEGAAIVKPPALPGDSYLMVAEYKYCQDDFGKWILFKKEEKNKFNLHIMHHDNIRYIEQLIFRDALRADSQFLKNL